MNQGSPTIILMAGEVGEIMIYCLRILFFFVATALFSQHSGENIARAWKSWNKFPMPEELQWRSGCGVSPAVPHSDDPPGHDRRGFWNWPYSYSNGVGIGFTLWEYYNTSMENAVKQFLSGRLPDPHRLPPFEEAELVSKSQQETMYIFGNSDSLQGIELYHFLVVKNGVLVIYNEIQVLGEPSIPMTKMEKETREAGRLNRILADELGKAVQRGECAPIPLRIVDPIRLPKDIREAVAWLHWIILPNDQQKLKFIPKEKILMLFAPYEKTPIGEGSYSIGQYVCDIWGLGKSKSLLSRYLQRLGVYGRDDNYDAQGIVVIEAFRRDLLGVAWEPDKLCQEMMQWLQTNYEVWDRNKNQWIRKPWPVPKHN